MTSKFPKLTVDTICVETTRRCNMQCAHCMRGEAQNKNLLPDAVDFLFERVNQINTIVPTGGEPTLNPDALREITNAIHKHHVYVSGVYLVTNGLVVTDHFLKEFMNLLLATDMDEYSSGLALSQDIFHDKIPEENIRRLSLFKCYRPDDKKVDWTRIQPFNLGRAAENCPVETREPFKMEPFYDAEIDDDGNITLWDTTLALTVDGDLLAGSEYAYDQTDRIKICNIFDPDWFEILTKKVREEIGAD